MAVDERLRPSEFPDDRFEEVTTTRAGVRAAFVVIVLVALPVRFWLAARIETPWIMVDELIYSELAKSFAEDAALLVREASIGWFNPGYPILLSPAWLVTDSVATSYALAKALNVVFACVAAVPVFVWARRLVSPPWALVAAGLTLLVPGLLYAGTLMGENAFLPAFLLASLTAALALERPTYGRQAIALAAMSLAIFMRLQALVLLAVLPTALVFKAALDARLAPPGERLRVAWQTIRGFWPSAAAVGVLAAAYATYKASQGQALLGGFGGYEAIGDIDYVSEESARWVVRHLAGLVLAAGYVPVAALLVLLGLAVWRGNPIEGERAFLAVATAGALWLVVQAAVFATHFSQRVEERYMFHAVPLLLIALALWLARGLPRRPWPVVIVAAALPAALLAFALPLARLLNVSILSDTFSLIPLLRLSNVLGSVGDVELLLTLAAIAAAAGFALVPRVVALPAFPAAVAVFFAATTWSASGAIRDYSAALETAAGGPERAWIDERLGRDAEADYLFAGGGDPFAEASVLWQTEFWNRSVDDVASASAVRVGLLPQTDVAADPLTGHIAPSGTGAALDSEHVVAHATLALAGERVATHGPLVLYRVDRPLRLAHSLQGVYADGWMGGSASLMQYSTPGDRPGTLRLELSRRGWTGTDVPGRVLIRVGRPVQTPSGVAIARPTAERRWTIHAGATRTFRLPTPRPPFRVEIAVDPTFSPSQFGHADPRQLGAQVAFSLSLT